MFDKDAYDKKYREEHREEQKAYLKKYAINNKERLKTHRAARKDKLKIYDQEYYKKHSDIIKKRAKDRYDKDPSLHQKEEKQRRKVDRYNAINHYSKGTMKCACCDCSKYVALTIDHMNNNGNEHREEIGHSAIYRWLRKNNYPEGYQVLCYNCNVPKMREDELGLPDNIIQEGSVDSTPRHPSLFN